MDDRKSKSRARQRQTTFLCVPMHRLDRALVALVLGWVASTAAHARCEVHTLELPVKMVGQRAIATVGINGTPVPLAVDSGAFYSILTEAAAAQLKLPLARSVGVHVQGITGSADAYTTRVDKLQLLKGEVPRVDFIVGGNEPGAGAMGLMGRNLLSFADTEYDLAHGVIRFLVPNDDCAKADMAYWAGSSPVTEVDLLTDWRARRLPSIRVRASLNGSEVVALLDSGAASTLVSARAARRAGVAETAMTAAGAVHGVGRGSAKAWTALFEKFEIGNEAMLRNRLRVADFDLEEADMLVGVDFFLSHRIYVSKQQSKMFFTYNGGPVFPFDQGAAAFGADPAASGVEAASADALARRGAASATRGDFAGALGDLDQACELEPTSAALFAQRGAIQEALKHPAKALGDFDKALELDPAETDARARRARLRFSAKDRDGAKADLDVLDETLAPQAQLRLSMSRLYMDLEQPAQALAQLNRWLAAHPHEVQREVALHGRCVIRLRLGIELKEALDDCDDAVDADSKNPAYRDSRGWAYLRLGQYRKALSDFDRGIESRPGNAWALYGRGLAQTRMGNAAQGDADLAAARKLEADIDAKVTRSGLAAQP